MSTNYPSEQIMHRILIIFFGLHTIVFTLLLYGSTNFANAQLCNHLVHQNVEHFYQPSKFPHTLCHQPIVPPPIWEPGAILCASCPAICRLIQMDRVICSLWSLAISLSRMPVTPRFRLPQYFCFVAESFTVWLYTPQCA